MSTEDEIIVYVASKDVDEKYQMRGPDEDEEDDDPWDEPGDEPGDRDDEPADPYPFP